MCMYFDSLSMEKKKRKMTRFIRIEKNFLCYKMHFFFVVLVRLNRIRQRHLCESAFPVSSSITNRTLLLRDISFGFSMSSEIVLRASIRIETIREWSVFFCDFFFFFYFTLCRIVCA
jgi:hypothetical protein